jgi:RNA polymerase primary sigma factor
MQTSSSSRSRTRLSAASARPLTHARLDRRLSLLARSPESFHDEVRKLCALFDARGLDLEITDPSCWRDPATAARVNVEGQLTYEIERVRRMDREEELRLALRIEFARTRLDCTLEAGEPGSPQSVERTEPSARASRRRLEWHALRLEMVERNLYLVLINVERYRHTRAERSDLIQAAAAGMFRAVDGYDWRRGLLFRTYAVHWLNQGFREHLYNFGNTVRVPIYLQKSVKHLDAAQQRLGDPHASVDELVRESGLRKGIVESVRKIRRRMRSLDAPLDGFDGTRTLASELALQGDEDPYSPGLEDVSIESGVETALSGLNPRERRVVELRFGIGTVRAHVYSEIAVELGVSLERVRQILLNALTKMRTPGLLKQLEPLIV